MADNVTAPGVGVIFASDDIGGVQYPRTKIAFGVDGSASDVSAANGLPVTFAAQVNARTVVEYSVSGNVRQAVTASTSNAALPSLSASRIVSVVGSVRTFINTGTSGVTASVGAGSMPVPSDTIFHFVVPASHTHIAVIRDGATDGNMTITAAAN